MNLPENNC